MLLNIFQSKYIAFKDHLWMPYSVLIWIIIAYLWHLYFHNFENALIFLNILLLIKSYLQKMYSCMFLKYSWMTTRRWSGNYELLNKGWEIKSPFCWFEFVYIPTYNLVLSFFFLFDLKPHLLLFPYQQGLKRKHWQPTMPTVTFVLCIVFSVSLRAKY